MTVALIKQYQGKQQQNIAGNFCVPSTRTSLFFTASHDAHLRRLQLLHFPLFAAIRNNTPSGR